MSAADIPYHLRSAKYADRALFVELLRRLERWVPLDDYVYVSMGGYTMSDHIRVMKVLGISNLISFDLNDSTVARAAFNRPTERTLVKKASAEDIATNLDDLMDEWKVPACTGRIVWFDFTTPKRLQNDLVSFGKLVSSSKPGDILRITLNAEPSNLPLLKVDGEELTIEERRDRKIRQVLRDDDFQDDDPNVYDQLPKILARAIGRISTAAAGRKFRCVCLSSVVYSDETQMVSVTLAVVPQPSDDKYQLSTAPHAQAKLEGWPLSSIEWDDVHRLSIHTLTSRERAHLERHLPFTDPATALSEFGYNVLNGCHDPVDYLNKYGKLIRFYPDFVSAT